ncbi:MAG: hypothetical protein ACLPI9_03575 [Halobacteriota archaeon]
MQTGKNERAAAAIANELSLRECYAVFCGQRERDRGDPNQTSFAVLAFPGIITLWLAVGVGEGLSLAIILNALRIGSR